ncbi:Uncharacterised protein [uncultured archaeon]|nr:Uncharacterised protein [uncultured archaeon]
MLERQIRYNRFTSTAEQEFERHKWIFLVINEPRELSRIKERIFSQLKPISFKKLGYSAIPLSGGLYYDYFSFTSERGEIEEPNKIYHSKKFKQDRDLTEKRELELLKYLEPIFEGRK